MAQTSNDLPEGTDTIISGASETGGSGSSAGFAATSTDNDSLVRDSAFRGTSSGGSWTEKLRGGTDKLSEQAATKTRDLVGQGLERGGEALANVAKMIGETATGLDERLGEEYGDYARRAAAGLENAANSIASKNADELLEDTREFIRKSPGVALAGAAIIGFAVARLVKNGMARDDEDEGTPRDRRSAA
jgi:hypothetical protein